MIEPDQNPATDLAAPWAQAGRQPRIAIIGAGMSGIAAVVKLQKAGYTDLTATGVLHQPVTPDIDGLDSFEGACFHSSRWDHSIGLAGKRVGIIGSGSTAAQIVGAITDRVGEMHVFQRTPQWMAPRPQKKYSP